MNLDRFTCGRSDPAEAEVMTHCAGCGGEIYQGEDVYVVNGEILHNDWECLVRYIDPEVTTVEEAVRAIVGVE